MMNQKQLNKMIRVAMHAFQIGLQESQGRNGNDVGIDEFIGALIDEESKVESPKGLHIKAGSKNVNGSIVDEITDAEGNVMVAIIQQ